MQYGLALLNGGVCGDARVLAELGCLAEETRWDGVFVEAGVTWWVEYVPAGELEERRENVKRGPLRIE